MECVLCENRYVWDLFDSNKLIRKKQIASICEKHKKCLLCRSDLTLEEMKESLYYDLDIGVCFQHWCCKNPYKSLELCSVCQQNLFCKTCGNLDANGTYVCKGCYKIYQHYFGGKNT